MIQFKKVVLHNFGSYGHVELELQNKGFCLVSGQNNCIKDNALSNGAGKSFLWSAICFALTGETINGIKTNLKNINIDEPDCFVQLNFNYNKDLFKIIRTITPKSELKIFKNNLDCSGKGIKESAKKLQELLPELNKDLIASTIIIGQGMPNKFSSFSPSGRKDLLEKLTKSDFMIEDLKSRIQARLQEIASKTREFEDSLIVNKTQLTSYLDSLERLKATVETQSHKNFDQLITQARDKIAHLQQEVAQQELVITQLENQREKLNKKLLDLSEEKSRVSANELEAYTTSYTELSSEKARISANVINLNNEITRLKAIVDICPTCGQTLPHVHKPDTSEQESLLVKANKELTNIEAKILKCNSQHQEYLKQINIAFNDEITNLNNTLVELKQKIAINKNNCNNSIVILEKEKDTYNKLVYDKQNWESFLKNQQIEITKLETEVAKLTNLIATISLNKEDYDQRSSIVKKMDLLARRDFRGYLLTNIIAYIDNRAKDYCNIVFGTKDLSLMINGNALDIIYCNKPFDSLSGGEKQRVDLIIQLAIRDLLINYLGLNSNILVLDEVTDFLDKKSCQAVMNLLENELQTVESVFIVSHHAEELEIPIDSEIKIIKNEFGISSVYE